MQEQCIYLYCFLVNWEELETLAHKLRLYTEQAMKMEVAPWIRDYVTNMDELYTELTLEKIHDRPVGEEAEPINHYKDFFVQSNDDEVVYESDPSVEYEILDPSHTVSKNLLATLCESCQEKVKSFHEKQKETSQTNNKKLTVEIIKNVKVQTVTKGMNILLKGDPGMGKSTLMKKIAWDWARRIFTTFTIVFVIFLKLVNPGDPIENVIIKQNPVLEGLGITPEKLKSILDTFGNRCLLVLDGLDEHVLGQNEDVVKIVWGQKLLDCHIILSSRPHSTREIQQCFPTIVRIDGFTENKAELFSSKILCNQSKIQDVLRFNPVEFRDDIPMYKCPILLSFMCLLVREDDIDLSSKTISIGEIYSRMIHCLYKKFTIQKNIEYEDTRFIKTITNLGKLALFTLLSGNPLLQRSRVIKVVGPDAFDYGLLIGHEDFRLIPDESADIFITFPHRSIQEFLGAFYFIMMLDAGSSIESLLGYDYKEPIFMVNPLFFHFCLWLSYSDQKYFTFENRIQTCQVLVGYCVRRLAPPMLDLANIVKLYPALDILGAFKKNDTLCLTFLKEIYKDIQALSAQSVEDLDYILPDVKSQIKYISAPGFSISLLKKGTVIIRINGRFPSQFLNVLNGWNTIHVQMILRQGQKFDVSDILWEKITTLYFVSNHEAVVQTSTQKLLAKTSRKMTHLSFVNLIIDETVLTALRKTVSDGQLPNLTHLGFINCSGVAGILMELFRPTWPRLSHLNLCDTKLTETELSDVYKSEHILPKLKSIVFSTAVCSSILVQTNRPGLLRKIDYFTNNILEIKTVTRVTVNDQITGIFLRNLTPNLEHLNKVSSLILHRCITVGNDLERLKAVQTTLKYTLHKIDISHSKISGKLSEFLWEPTFSYIFQFEWYPSLNSLIPSDCGLNSQNLCSLAQASVEGRLPQLTHLDISKNPEAELHQLFTVSCHWNQLLKLNIMGIRYQTMQSGCLQSLQELSLSDCRILVVNLLWPKLQILCIDNSNAEILEQIGDARERSLPNIMTVCIQTGHDMSSVHQPAVFNLIKRNISVHEAILSHDPFTSSSCVCQLDVPHSEFGLEEACSLTCAYIKHVMYSLWNYKLPVRHVIGNFLLAAALLFIVMSPIHFAIVFCDDPSFLLIFNAPAIVLIYFVKDNNVTEFWIFFKYINYCLLVCTWNLMNVLG